MDPIYWYTLYRRPYVFIFCIVWWILSRRHLGVKPSLSWLVGGYLIAWGSEALSIRTGFPYGWYVYHYHHLKNEWLFLGVPVWDSASYVFLTYAGLCVALLALRRWRKQPLSEPSRTGLAEHLVLAGVTVAATTLLDVIIDPIAHQGKKWFLGDIYYYPNPGAYFDVPLSNFLGWFGVTFLICFTFLQLAKSCRWRLSALYRYSAILLGTGFYFSIGLFNISIAAWIRSWELVLIDSIYLGLLTLLLALTPRRPFSR